MLLSFEFSNFRSFVGDAELHATTRALRTNVPRAGESWREMIETAVAIYGPNASGKTTLLDAIRALAVSVRNPGDGAVFQPSKQGRREDLTKYRVNYVSEGVRYEYQVSAAHSISPHFLLGAADAPTSRHTQSE